MANLLDQAIKTDDLDAALKPIMDALGIEGGDCAAQIFSGGVDWKDAGPASRSGMLSAWLRAECLLTVAEGQ